MDDITNDRDFKQALDSLSAIEQRAVGSRFAKNVLALNDDFRIRRVVEVAGSPGATEEDLASAYKGVRSVVVETYTACGHDAEWLAQAGHFVAAAAAAAALPVGEGAAAGNPAWRAAMHARMARTCEMIASGEGGTHTEAEEQYAILMAFLEQAARTDSKA
ncbi:MAG: hypothetical protein PVF51_02425 [Nitrospirota bacterium]|jgi:hypothetical protein